MSSCYSVSLPVRQVRSPGGRARARPPSCLSFRARECVKGPCHSERARNVLSHDSGLMSRPPFGAPHEGNAQLCGSSSIRVGESTVGCRVVGADRIEREADLSSRLVIPWPSVRVRVVRSRLACEAGSNRCWFWTLAARATTNNTNNTNNCSYLNGTDEPCLELFRALRGSIP